MVVKLLCLLGWYIWYIWWPDVSWEWGVDDVDTCCSWYVMNFLLHFILLIPFFFYTSWSPSFLLFVFRFFFPFFFFISFPSITWKLRNCETEIYGNQKSWVESYNELHSRRLDVFWCCCLASSSVSRLTEKSGETWKTRRHTLTLLYRKGSLATSCTLELGDFMISLRFKTCFGSEYVFQPTSMSSWLQVSATFIWVKSQRSACEGKRQRQWDTFPTQSRYFSLDLGVKNAMRLFINLYSW